MNYNFLLHIHPKKISTSALVLNRTFGLGGMAALLVIIQFITGLLLKFHYEPTPDKAYNSILYINQGLYFGLLIRNIHHWSSIFLVWVAFLHLLRVVFTGAFYAPRHINWYFGIGLLVLVVLSNFTGYLLPWDQLSYWAVTISTNLVSYIPWVGNPLKSYLLSGDSVNQITLANFYHLHTGIFPILFIVLMVWHFWHVRKAGGVILSREQKEEPLINTNPGLIAREAVVALLLMAVVLLFSLFIDAPLLERADPLNSPNPAKAPWYFMGFQELLIHVNPTIAVVVLPLIILAFAIWMPYSKPCKETQGIWFASDKGKKAALFSLMAGTTATLLFVIISHLLPDPEKILPQIPGFITMGIIPLVLWLAFFYSIITYLSKKWQLATLEKIQSLIAFLISAYVIFSFVGIYFRGPGMELLWPWQF